MAGGIDMFGQRYIGGIFSSLAFYSGAGGDCRDDRLDEASNPAAIAAEGGWQAGIDLCLKRRRTPDLEDRLSLR